MLLSVAVLALLASAQGRAVNISNTWVLPEEGFPVFYRYFRDRISWYEADAVCQFHHANLVTVDTTAQYDAVRAYLKELDISTAVWVGLIRSNPDGDFTWTDYRGLSGDGYWSTAPDARSAPLCAAADPAVDYRWEARACGGPTVASFICELPVPQWALGIEGCMIRALPALTILYLPESAAVQLTADCGMAGVKKVQCTGNVKREDLLKELSCADEEEQSSTSGIILTSSNGPMSTDTTFADQDTTNEVTTEESITTEHEIDINQPRDITATSLPYFIYSQTQYKTSTKLDGFNKSGSPQLSKNVNLGENGDNNAQSNYISKTADEDNVLTNDQLEKLEDERHMQHKMLHEEIARVGNVDNIFTQPTDHFIPPLVMAKAKISDDMTVLSLAEKHAQQLAERQFNKQNMNPVTNNRSNSDSYGTPAKSSKEEIDKPLIVSVKPTKLKDSKKESLKSNLPKKYVNEKHYDVKNKISKNTETRVTETDKATEIPITTEYSIKSEENTTKKIYTDDTYKNIMRDDLGMDLTVFLKDAPFTSEEQPSFSGDVPKLETIKNSTLINYTESTDNKYVINMNVKVDLITSTETTTVDNVTMDHEITKVTVIAGDNNTAHKTSGFEINTKMPVFRDSFLNDSFISTPSTTLHSETYHTTESKSSLNQEITTITNNTVIENKFKTTPIAQFTSTTNSGLVLEDITTAHPVFTSTEITTSGQKHSIKTEVISEVKNVSSTTSLPITVTDSEITKQNTTTASNESIEKNEFNSAEYHEILTNMSDHRHTDEEDSLESDFQSPLLSGVMEPMHRPPRARRPQQPNRNKFNPLRILG